MSAEGDAGAPLADALRRARAAFERGEAEAGLSLLIQAWRSSRSAAVADLIDRVGEKLARADGPIRGSGSVSDLKAWLKVFESHAAGGAGPSALTRLLEALPKTTGLTAKARLDRLRGLPPDPRVGRAVAGWLREPPFDGKNRARCFPVALALLTESGDPRALPRLRELDDPSHRAATIAAIGLVSLKPLRAARTALEAVRPRADDAASLAELSGIEAAALSHAPHGASSADPEALLREIWARPDDLQLRVVLADLLEARGDPRGELISLQCAREASGAAPSAQERKLLARFERVWLGAIEPFVLKSGVVFRRGFVSACALTNKTPDPALPEWATVERLDMTRLALYVGSDHELVAAGALKSLRALVGASTAALEHLCAVEPARDLDELGVSSWGWVPHQTGLLPKLARLPSLRRLGLQDRSRVTLGGDAVDALFSEIAQLRLEALRLEVGGIDLAELLRRVAANTELVRLDLATAQVELAWRRTGELDVRTSSLSESTARWLAAGLAGAPGLELRAVEVWIKRPVGAPVRRLLAEAAAARRVALTWRP